MYQAKSGVKNFSLYWGGGGGSLDKKFFPSLKMYQAKSGVKNFSLYWGRGGGEVPRQNIFPWSEHVLSQIWCQKFFPLLRPGTPPPPPPENLRPGNHPLENLRPGTPPENSETWDPPPPSMAGSGTPPTWTWTWDPPPHRKSETWDLPPPENSETWDPPPRPWLDRVPPPSWTWTWDPPPVEVWTDTQSENITPRHPSDAGGKTYLSLPDRSKPQLSKNNHRNATDNNLRTTLQSKTRKKSGISL